MAACKVPFSCIPCPSRCDGISCRCTPFILEDILCSASECSCLWKPSRVLNLGFACEGSRVLPPCPRLSGAKLPCVPALRFASVGRAVLSGGPSCLWSSGDQNWNSPEGPTGWGSWTTASLPCLAPARRLETVAWSSSLCCAPYTQQGARALRHLALGLAFSRTSLCGDEGGTLYPGSTGHAAVPLSHFIGCTRPAEIQGEGHCPGA